MFDLGWTELLVIGIVALIVVGPKDLPGMFRALGKFTAKARRMAREFQNAMNEAADEAGVKDVSKDLRNIANPRKMGLDALKDATGDLTDWKPDQPSPSTTKKGTATAALSEERAEAATKIRDAAAKKASERIAREKAAAEAPAEAPQEPAPAPAAKKPATRKAPAKKPATRKPAAKTASTTAKSASAKPDAAKKTPPTKAKAAPKKAATPRTRKKPAGTEGDSA